MTPRSEGTLVPLALILGSVLVWAMLRPPAATVAWPGPVSGIAVAPYAPHQDPANADQPDAESLSRDLALLARLTGHIRTYSLAGSHARLPVLAARHGLALTVGVPVHADAVGNALERERLKSAVVGEGSIRRAIIGNESLLRGDVTAAALMSVLDRARAELGIPVSTAEPWHVWLRHRDLSDHVDFITVHLLPYWEGIPVEQAVDVIDARLAELRAAFPGKPLVIGEVGWPSRGRDRGGARASPANQARFLAEFLARAAAGGHDYFLMEAFDQPWKRRLEGDVGAYWGILDADRRAKVSFAGAPWWSSASLLASLLPAGATALLALLVWMALRADAHRLRRRGHDFLALAGWLAAMATVAMVVARSGQYWTPSLVLGSGIVAVLFLGAALVWLVEAHEWAEARWGVRVPPPPPPARGDLPTVSLHLPVCNEPPALVIDTLECLARLDYPALEILVVDNNTRDEAVWGPVRDACARLGKRFRFFHREQLAGYKAGALNLALAHTSPDATVVAVIDADYQVSPQWLRSLVPYFQDTHVQIVQAPQDYRDAEPCDADPGDGHHREVAPGVGGDRGRAGSPFKRLCHAEYRGFFRLGMPVRDARNAIITHGTMTLLRRKTLETVGGWSPWSITEDAELGLRMLAAGGVARYERVSHGRGLTPDNFLDYKRQRFRWALGAVHILREHAGLLTGRRSSALNWGQRYHFVAGWLPWLADGASLVLVMIALAWSALMLIGVPGAVPPEALVSGIPVFLLAARIVKQIHLYRSCVAASWSQTLGGALAGMALMPTVGVAVLLGAAGARRDFLRTPKLARAHSVPGALRAARWEGVMAVALLAAATTLGAAGEAGVDLIAWRSLLASMSLPFLSAIIVSLISALPVSRREFYSPLSVVVPDGRKP